MDSPGWTPRDGSLGMDSLGWIPRDGFPGMDSRDDSPGWIPQDGFPGMDSLGWTPGWTPRDGSLGMDSLGWTPRDAPILTCTERSTCLLCWLVLCARPYLHGKLNMLVMLAGICAPALTCTESSTSLSCWLEFVRPRLLAQKAQRACYAGWNWYAAPKVCSSITFAGSIIYATSRECCIRVFEKAKVYNI